MSRAGGQAGQGGRVRRARDFTKPWPWGEGFCACRGTSSLALERIILGVAHCVWTHQLCLPPQRESNVVKASQRGENSQKVLSTTLSRSSEDAWS